MASVRTRLYAGARQTALIDDLMLSLSLSLSLCAGTDHAWGGNNFVMGGAVRGGLIHGQYPDTSAGADLDTGRGRLIPTTPWDGVWHAIAEWMDVAPEKLVGVLPNLENFERGTTLLTREQVFSS
jgi:uncharacterized protein (DUF1501 family)